MKQNDKSFIYIVLISIIVCAGVGFLIIKSGESYDPVLYSEVYEELDEMENYITNNSKYNTEDVDETDLNEFDSYKQGKIIAILTIDKLGLKYPVLKETTEENLKVAPTKFWGADPNEVGNFCIAGHNYGNAQHFSGLSNLVIGDIVKVMDTKGISVSYKIYAKNLINENDLECTSQITDGKKEVTLITCTDDKSQRLAIKCVEV
jgi:LPXTG-site transpeptidase (sortase) family protein